MLEMLPLLLVRVLAFPWRCLLLRKWKVCQFPSLFPRIAILSFFLFPTAESAVAALPATLVMHKSPKRITEVGTEWNLRRRQVQLPEEDTLQKFLLWQADCKLSVRISFPYRGREETYEDVGRGHLP